jgi:hypothetical protein
VFRPTASNFLPRAAKSNQKPPSSTEFLPGFGSFLRGNEPHGADSAGGGFGMQ